MLDISKAITMTTFHWDNTLGHLSDQQYDDVMYDRKTEAFVALAKEQGVDINDAVAYKKWYVDHIVEYGKIKHDVAKLSRDFYDGKKLNDLELQYLLDHEAIRFYTAYLDSEKVEFCARSPIELTSYGYSLLNIPVPNSTTLFIKCDRKLLEEEIKKIGITIEEKWKLIRKELTKNIKEILSKYKSYTSPYDINKNFHPTKNWRTEYILSYTTIDIGNIVFEKKEDAAEFILKLSDIYKLDFVNH